ncbi:MAG: hypothetical protein EOP04_02990 [Proteobacteria bacterium]|nr:MAG: hypothetical protein EOP04_02990 [Pseudomonadota bacterium]
MSFQEKFGFRFCNSKPASTGFISSTLREILLTLTLTLKSPIHRAKNHNHYFSGDRVIIVEPIPCLASETDPMGVAVKGLPSSALHTSSEE